MQQEKQIITPGRIYAFEDDTNLIGSCITNLVEGKTAIRPKV